MLKNRYRARNDDGTWIVERVADSHYICAVIDSEMAHSIACAMSAEASERERVVLAFLRNQVRNLREQFERVRLLSTVISDEDVAMSVKAACEDALHPKYRKRPENRRRAPMEHTT